jgi:thioredoxin reductase (NADPH)
MTRKRASGENSFDFIIIGAGGTGLAAGMYGARLGMKTLVLGATYGTELPIGGVITTTNIVENYPGFIKLSGTELAKKIEDHTREYDLVSIREEKVSQIKKGKNCFEVRTNKEIYKGSTVLFATGTKWKKLEVPGSTEFENKGVAYCALCDAPLFKNKIVAVVGGSDSAAKDALVLAEHAKKVYIIYRGEKIRPEPINLKRINANKKIEIINKTNIIEVKGSQFVDKVILDKSYNGKKELDLQGVFVAIGHIALSDLAKSVGVKLNKKGEIILDHKTSETNIAGVFGAGDVADKPFKQAITGVAEGCTAAYSAFQHITKNEIEPC